MILLSAALFLLSAADGAEQLRPIPAGNVAQVVVHQRTIIRIPVRLRQPSATTAVDWEERRGPDCIPTAQIVGATFLGQNSVDLILKNNRRIRARLENKCPALDYYYGFYLTRSSDGKICADRDLIRSRVGGQCEIEAFRTLTAAPKR
ncbi:hypothetical protein IC614_05590 [Allosphingosinicella flava]|uniref:Uncharacterized protein n=1 Tax=Allosphingosinicella flava TaxID=2771430 RepID=A0A7T2LN67_9SPHN|nr:hypothetical protein [Sphingosinicella flava]QPQ56048.1 hypothetical protein IC614_05590 [Sphingosinicella flava]